jgi:hypothetical protein
LYTFKIKKFFTWINSLSYDIVFDIKDILPFLKQAQLLLYYKNLANEKNMSLSQVTSYDIEYDGI